MTSSEQQPQAHAHTSFDSTLLRRGVAEIIVEEEFVELLHSGRKLRLKEGFDPSAPDIHLGHVVTLRKLRQLQDLGHQVVLIVADWTARIGDPSGQSETRPMLTKDQIEKNARTYMDQFFKLVDKEKTEVRRQSEWFDAFTLDDVIRLASNFTVAQLLAREDFSRRYSSGSPISVTEMLYPLLQAYDSVAINADVEFGGTDQKFNCLLGRELQQAMGQEPQHVFFVPILAGTDGVRKMSKSLGNYIGVDEAPREMYGKVMSIPDNLMLQYYELVTDVSDEEIANIAAELRRPSANPMHFKKRLARTIVEEFHGNDAAADAEGYFERVFQTRRTPEDVPEVTFPALESRAGLARIDLAPTLVRQGLVKSNSDFKRLVSQGAVELDGEKLSSTVVSTRSGSVLKLGRRNFLRIRVT